MLTSVEHITPLPLHAKGAPGGPGPDGGKHPDESRESDTGESGRALYCKICRSKITRRNLAMSVDGQHKHVFFNPYGIVFEIGCFASAKNVVVSGPKTDEFTWFPGYVWQAMGCSGCSTLLGWRYTGDKGGFYGLILGALIEEEDTGK